ncbi:[LysW]-aminoadipate/[LysW]-glutamate kinase [Thermococcus paralvinellae]|uniref:Putative [LysW]-aminoadipate/[LysW]-glutamate kinase n=1 Tax=Thermococcus paralvinellae TaxID=582419 RepID=W0I673_9EURY|nr:[LysW]-aminoadipate/[LysW]-glutamate kinase [Thermococcus paralvinellae]AHF79903.1 acetylglutamate/acetylaminoadipate kinase [Thermococcus paralvinellae]
MRVVKIGGAVLDRLEEFDGILEGDIITHGGSDYVDELSKRLGMEVKRLKSPSGVEFRYTPKEVLEIYLMGIMKANKRIVSLLQSRGINAIGLSGLDLGLIKAERKKLIKAVINGKKVAIRDDYSGIIREINVKALKELSKVGVPVIAPIAMSEAYEPLNIDGDKLAHAIALSLKADELVFLTDTAFLADGEIVEKIKVNQMEKFLPFARGGMKRKLLMAKKSVESGVKKVIIQGLNGRTVIE